MDTFDDRKPKLAVISGRDLQAELDKAGYNHGYARFGYYVISNSVRENIETGELIDQKCGFDPVDVSFGGCPFDLNIIDTNKIPLLEEHFNLIKVSSLKEAEVCMSRNDVTGHKPPVKVIDWAEKAKTAFSEASRLVATGEDCKTVVWNLQDALKHVGGGARSIGLDSKEIKSLEKAGAKIAAQKSFADAKSFLQAGKGGEVSSALIDLEDALRRYAGMGYVRAANTPPSAGPLGTTRKEIAKLYKEAGKLIALESYAQAERRVARGDDALPEINGLRYGLEMAALGKHNNSMVSRPVNVLTEVDYRGAKYVGIDPQRILELNKEGAIHRAHYFWSDIKRWTENNMEISIYPAKGLAEALERAGGAKAAGIDPFKVGQLFKAKGIPYTAG